MNRITHYQVSREVPCINLNTLVNRPIHDGLICEFANVDIKIDINRSVNFREGLTRKIHENKTSTKILARTVYIMN